MASWEVRCVDVLGRAGAALVEDVWTGEFDFAAVSGAVEVDIEFVVVVDIGVDENGMFGVVAEFEVLSAEIDCRVEAVAEDLGVV